MDFSLSAIVLRRRSCRLRDLGSTRWGKSMGSWQVCTRTRPPCSRSAVRLDLAPGAADGPPAASQGQEQPTSLYKVITNPVGFINHFTGLEAQPNCKLILKEGMPLGEHCLVVKSTRAIREDKEWLLNYGPLHRCVEPVDVPVERVTRKRPRQGAGEETV